MEAVCGPEPMMTCVKGVLDGRWGSRPVLLERYMKCAVGICASAALDDTGWRVCAEGPVFLGA